LEELYNYLPKELVNFVLVTLFSLLIGLSQRKISLKHEGETTLFGTDRTFTFIGILGYLLYMLDPLDYRLFMGGGAVLGVLLALNYYVKQSQFHLFGLTTIVIALITYCIAPIVATQPSWFYIMVVVTVLLLTELKHTFTELAQRMKNDEMITLAKFLAISGIILPILPNKDIIPGIPLTPYTIWLATVVVSGMSYLSYLLKRYVFKESGILVSGVIGGLYSSTATISVLARKSRKASEQEATEYVSAMLLAISMMFLRFLLLIGIFSLQILLVIYPYLLLMSGVSAGVAWYFHTKRRKTGVSLEQTEEEDSSNPLEFKVALVFAVLFVVFTIITHYTLTYAGTGGLNALSFVSGFSDITPFILNLLQGTGVAALVVTGCCMQAIVSNMIVNMLQGRGSSFLDYSMSVNKSFLDKRLTLSAFAGNFFKKYMHNTSTLEGIGFNQESWNKYSRQRFGVSISYRLGELKASVKKAERSISNDDVKSGGGSGNGGQE
jgi:Predicted membrane protein